MPHRRLIREKRHRLPRDRYRGRVSVAFTACIESGRLAFADASIVGEFRDLLAAAAAKHGCLVLIYCFMPDHLHVILHGQNDTANTFAAMLNFKQRSGYWFGQNRPNLRWQKDFYDHVIHADEDLRAQVRYVADNPVRRGLVRVWSECPHTGAIGIDLQRALTD